MSIIRSIHETAMEYVMRGDIAKMREQYDDAHEAYNVAFDLERTAALKLKVTDRDPSWRGILLRSAAAISLKAKRYAEGEKILQIAYSENPPKWLKTELKDIENALIEATKAKADPFEIKGIVTKIDTIGNEITISDSPTHYAVFVKSKIEDIVKKYLQKAVKVEARKTAHGLLVLEKISLAA